MLCVKDVNCLFQNEGYWGCGNGIAGVCWRTVEDGWWFFANACVEICWRWVHWQRGVRCVGSQGRHLTAREPPWEQNGIPPIVNIIEWSRLNLGAWREHLISQLSWVAAWLFVKRDCSVHLVVRYGYSPGLVSGNKSTVKFGTWL